MGVNWSPENNPQTIPRFGPIPRIALPTVFGDALSYMEMIGRYNAELNNAIDGINNLAKNLETAVQESVKNAKIPVYISLVNNGSAIISPFNWNVENPKDLYDAISAGKLCILNGEIGFNSEGLPVVKANDKMYFVLTEVYQLDATLGENGVRCVFISYDAEHIRYVDLKVTKNGNDYGSEVNDIRELGFPTEAEFEQVDNLFRKCLFVYKGSVRVPENEGQYIELTNNGTETDLSEYFVVQNGGTMFVPECAPAVCVDYYSGNVGELRYGGATEPWVRIYSYGVTIKANLDEVVEAMNDRLGEVDTKAQNAVDGVASVNHRVDEVEDAIGDIGTDVANVRDSYVSYSEQNKTATERERARTNIGAIGANDPVFTGEMTLQSGYGAAVTFTVTNEQGIVGINFYPQRIRIDGVIDPVSAQQVATKNYVDTAVGNVNAVLYTEQAKTAAEKATARSNIGAAPTNAPVFTDAITLVSETSTQQLSITFVPATGQRIINLGGSVGETIVRNVGDPVGETDAANKRYVDNLLVMSEGNVKYSVYQNLSDSQMAQARRNILAAGAYDPTFYRTMELLTDNEESVKFRFQGGTTERSLVHDDAGLRVEDSEGNLAPLRVGMRGEANEAITLEAVTALLAPIRVVINATNNAWTATRNGVSVSDYSAVINMYYNGTHVSVSYVTVDTQGVAYTTPLYAGYGIGIVCEGFDGYQRKRFVLNANGTVTTTVLETVNPNE